MWSNDFSAEAAKNAPAERQLPARNGAGTCQTPVTRSPSIRRPSEHRSARADRLTHLKHSPYEPRRCEQDLLCLICTFGLPLGLKRSQPAAAWDGGRDFCCLLPGRREACRLSSSPRSLRCGAFAASLCIAVLRFRRQLSLELIAVPGVPSEGGGRAPPGLAKKASWGLPTRPAQAVRG